MRSNLKKLLLPGMVRITTEKRQEENVRPTEDLNVPSFVEEFEPKVIFVHKLSEDVYRIQTLSSCITFVQTKSGGWLICQYLEGPIK